MKHFASFISVDTASLVRNVKEKSHRIETCVNLPCLQENCIKRHPPICRFYSRFGRCKFKLSCSYLHLSSNFPELEKEISILKKEVDCLKAENEILNSLVTRLERLENEIKLIRESPCRICDVKSTSEEVLDEHVVNSHETVSEENLFKCEFCDYASKSKKGVKIHRTAKHKEFVVPTATKHPINCILSEEGCTNILYQYYDMYTAICGSCSDMLDAKFQSTPFSHDLCPCCHEPSSSGIPLSFCSECNEDIYKDGYTNSRWGGWHLDRNTNKIVCVYLDYD